MAARLTPEQRRRVRDFVREVVDWSGKSWEELSFRAGVPSSTVHGWRYESATPEAPGLLDFLRAAGLLTEDYKIAAPRPVPLTAEEAAVIAAREAERALHLARQGQKKAKPRPERGTG